VTKPSAQFSDNEGVVAAASAGMGIASIGYWSCRRELEDGRLVQLLAQWEMVPTKVYAYFPLGKATRFAARSFIDFLAAKLNDKHRGS
jgi:DNA-binding transcriptional LysR family regulator